LVRASTRYLRGHDIPAPPRVRLEVRESRDVITSVRAEDCWPLDRTEWRPLYLTGAGLATAPSSGAGRITFDMRSRGACWEWTAPADTEITGPIALRLWVEAHGADDIDLFAGAEKWRAGTYIPFEGPAGWKQLPGWLVIAGHFGMDRGMVPGRVAVTMLAPEAGHGQEGRRG
jgi:hypothetical protein